MKKSAFLLLMPPIFITAAVLADTWSGDSVITAGERIGEARETGKRIQSVMKAHALDAILLTRVRNQAWALAGSDTRIVNAQQESPVWILYSSGGRRYLLSNNIEAERLMEEEGLEDLGLQPKVYQWFHGLVSGKDERWKAVEELVGGGQLGADTGINQAVDVSGDLARARFPLTEPERKKMRWLGSKAANAVAETCREITPGMKETDIAGVLAGKLWKEHIYPTVVLIGVDERLDRFRHLTPTSRILKKYCLVNLCAERWGLTVAVSRLVHFGEVPRELDRRMRACARVDAAALAASIPGAKFGGIFAVMAETYGRSGFAGEWKQHHQGGAIGYFEREFLSCPDSTDVVVEGMALAWNPTISGVKVEDTVLVGSGGFEILTPTPGWPMIKVEISGKTIERPGILVRPAIK